MTLYEVYCSQGCSQDKGQDYVRSVQKILDWKPHPLIKSRDLEYFRFCAL